MLVFQAALGLTPPLRVCTVSTCARNGGRAFCDAAQALGAIAELPVASSGCMSRCRGIVVAGGPLRSTTSLDLKIENTRAAMEAAACMLPWGSNLHQQISVMCYSRVRAPCPDSLF